MPHKINPYSHGSHVPIRHSLAADVEIVKGTYRIEQKTWALGDPLEGGVNATLFKNFKPQFFNTKNPEKGMLVRLTLADDGKDKGKITEIVVHRKNGANKSKK